MEPTGKPHCFKCNRALERDDIGFYKKMVNRGATQYQCIPCTAEHFGITTEKALELIERYRKAGCSLFL